MSNYHVGSDGSPKPCNAQPGNCPLGGTHFDSEEKAIKFAERMNEITAEKEELEEKVASLWRASGKVAMGSPAYEKVFDRILGAYQKLNELRDQEGVTAIETKYDTKVTKYDAPNRVLSRDTANLIGYAMRGPNQQKAELLDDGSVNNLYIHPAGKEGEKVEPFRVKHFDMTENMYITEDGQKFPMSVTYDAETNELHIPDYGYAYGDSEDHAIATEEEKPPLPRIHNGDRAELFSQDKEGVEGFVKYIRRRMESEGRETLNVNGEECSFLATEDEALKRGKKDWQYVVHKTDPYKY